MDDRSWMYRVSLKELCMMDYCNEVEDFINYTISNSKNISEGGIRYPCKKCKNKKFLNLNVVIMHLLQKRVHGKYMCWFAYEEPFFYENMVEKMVMSNFSSSTMHGVINYNSNRYRSMIMDAMRINKCDAGEFAIVDEESNVDATRFF